MLVPGKFPGCEQGASVGDVVGLASVLGISPHSPGRLVKPNMDRVRDSYWV